VLYPLGPKWTGIAAGGRWIDQGASEIQEQEALTLTPRYTHRFGQTCDDFELVETHVFLVGHIVWSLETMIIAPSVAHPISETAMVVVLRSNLRVVQSLPVWRGREGPNTVNQDN
jgi:hypothetical protein